MAGMVYYLFPALINQTRGRRTTGKGLGQGRGRGRGGKGRGNKLSCKKGNTSNGHGRWSLYLSAIPQYENQVIWISLLVAPTTLSCVWPHVSTPVHCHLNYAALHFPMFSLTIRVYPSFPSLVIQSACSSHPFIQYFTCPYHQHTTDLAAHVPATCWF